MNTELTPAGTLLSPPSCLASSCCQSTFRAAGGSEGTRWHECEACGKGCDIISIPIPSDRVTLKTLCTKCQKAMECNWPAVTTFGGVECTSAEYMAKALQSESVGIYCDDCLEQMPDVKLEDLRHD